MESRDVKERNYVKMLLQINTQREDAKDFYVWAVCVHILKWLKTNPGVYKHQHSANSMKLLTLQELSYKTIAFSIYFRFTWSIRKFKIDPFLRRLPLY